MAARGRGRGGFGGRGGRGGGPNQGPIARDDDGTIIPTTITGPPPLFPPVSQLPPVPELGDKDKLLLNRRRELIAFWRSSSYFLDRKSTAQEVDKFPVERYSDPGKVQPKRVREPLSTVLTLNPEHFPEELYSAKEKRARGASGAANAAFWRSQGNREGSGLNKLESLAAQEQRNKDLEAEGKEVKAGGEEEEGGEKKAEEGEEVEALDDDDDDDWADDDDYMQGEHYDDDEGYEDDGDGGDEGATY